jgi:VWFA-related protein
MRRLPLVCTIVLAATLHGHAQEMRTGETITVERIIIDARVTDAKGDPILGLEPRDFVVKVDGKLAEIQSMEWVPETAAARAIAGLDEEAKPPQTIDDEVIPEGRLLIFFVQTDFARNAVRSGGQMKVLPYAKQILESLEPEDRVAVFSFDSHLKFRLDFSSDSNRIYDAIESALAIDEPPPPQAVPNPSLARRIDRQAMRDATTSEEALLLLGNALRNIPGAKSLILLGWGLGKRSGNAVVMGGTYVIARNVLESARTAVFAIDTTLADYHDLELGLGKAASDTGGFYAKVNTFPQIAVDRLKGTLSGHYEIEVRKPDGLKPGTHAIDVQAKKRGAVVMARKSYIDAAQ